MSKAFSPNEIVWVKRPKIPWWPAKVKQDWITLLDCFQRFSGEQFQRKR